MITHFFQIKFLKDGYEYTFNTVRFCLNLKDFYILILILNSIDYGEKTEDQTKIQLVSALI